MPAYRALAEFYDAEHADEPSLRQDVPFFLTVAGPPGRLIEVGVGTGRAAVPLALAGWTVVGIDHDATLLAIAAARRTEAGLDERRLQLVRADARDLPNAGRFDAACLFFNTFAVFTTEQEQSDVLNGIADRLRPGGQVWIDLFNPDLPLLAGGPTVGMSPLLFRADSGQTVLRTVDVTPDPDRQRQQITVRYEWLDAAGRRRRRRNRFWLAWFTPRELTLMLRLHGFEVDGVWGDYDGSPVTGRSPRLIVSALRARGRRSGPVSSSRDRRPARSEHPPA